MASGGVPAKTTAGRMRRAPAFRRRAFSLIEVVIALGIVAFVLTALLATFPAGLDAESASRHESRATQFASLVFGMLQSAPFRDIPFFGERLDLSQPNLNAGGPGAAATVVELFGCVSPVGEVELRKTSDSDADYRICLRFTPQLRAGRVEASDVSVAITPRSQPGQTFHFTTVIGNFGS